MPPIKNEKNKTKKSLRGHTITQTIYNCLCLSVAFLLTFIISNKILPKKDFRQNEIP